MNQTGSDELWRVASDPLLLLEDLYPKRTLGSDQHQSRKCRLYLLACARRQWARLPGVCRGLVELAEYHAESARERKALRRAVAPIAEELLNSDGSEGDLCAADAQLARLVLSDFPELRERYLAGLAGAARELAPSVGADEWRGLAALVYLPLVSKTPPFGWVQAALHSAPLLREVYYNPHAFVAFPAAWRTSAVLGVADHMYNEREFSDMPILADALEDAGCTDAGILGHCRDAPGDAHVRGCWVLDLVLRRG